MQPTDQMSMGVEYSLQQSSSSGARYQSVTTIERLQIVLDVIHHDEDFVHVAADHNLPHGHNVRVLALEQCPLQGDNLFGAFVLRPVHHTVRAFLDAIEAEEFLYRAATLYARIRLRLLGLRLSRPSCRRCRRGLRERLREPDSEPEREFVGDRDWELYEPEWRRSDFAKSPTESGLPGGCSSSRSSSSEPCDELVCEWEDACRFRWCRFRSLPRSPRRFVPRWSAALRSRSSSGTISTSSSSYDGRSSSSSSSSSSISPSSSSSVSSSDSVSMPLPRSSSLRSRLASSSSRASSFRRSISRALPLPWVSMLLTTAGCMMLPLTVVVLPLHPIASAVNAPFAATVPVAVTFPLHHHVMAQMVLGVPSILPLPVLALAHAIVLLACGGLMSSESVVSSSSDGLSSTPLITCPSSLCSASLMIFFSSHKMHRKKPTGVSQQKVFSSARQRCAPE
uniref:Uncharacterized protein n=1 Tax=Anopheles coluzzii TaxID=1518534 RepID=A0A8W7P192_ANOCL